MTTFDPASLSPSADLLQFLGHLPSPFRQQLLVRLYMFFLDDVDIFADEPPDDVFEMIVEPHAAFQRAILIIGALDYIFSPKVPWSSGHFEELMKATSNPNYLTAISQKLTKAAMMNPGETANPVRDKPYLAARRKWRKVRSNWSNSTLHDFEQNLAGSSGASLADTK
jgi:hypothetical protein